MSNTRQARQTPGTDLFTQGGDLGLGYCYFCLIEYRADQDEGVSPHQPRFAITIGPAPVPGPTGGLFLIPMPSCWDHLMPASELAEPGGRPRLIRPR